MTQSDPFIDALMSPGAPFEVVQDGDIRVFKHAPKTLADVLDRARSFGDTPFIVSGDRRMTYAEFFERADALSAYLQNDAGITAGQSVAICMKNEPEWMIAFVAIMQAGMVAVLVNSRGSGQAMARAVSDADSVFVIADEKRLSRLNESECDVPSLVIRDFPSSNNAFTRADRETTDLAAMFFTSGTTGVAKAAAVSNRALVTGMMNTQLAMAAVFTKMAKAYNIDVETLRSQMPQSCSLLVFPLFHTSGCSAVFLTSMAMGGKLVLMHRWDADEALRLVQDEKITTLGGVPTMHWDLLRAKASSDYDLSSLMSLSCGGQALPIGLLNEIREAFPNAFIGAGYGMTETCGAVSQANGEAFLAKPEASGQILPMVDVRIVDGDDKPLEFGGVGEIQVRGATLMEGYYGREEDTAKSFVDGWFKTGDIGKVDEGGYIHIIDRKTDMVISGGENIYCAEVEQVLGRHPGIRQIAAFGVPDDRLGERLVVGFVPADSAVSAETVNAYARENLADYKVPSDYICELGSFPLNAMGKVEKQKVREAYLASKAA